MDEIETKNAIITSVRITTADHGCLIAWVDLDYGGSCQGFGGRVLYLPDSFTHSTNQANYAGHFIYRVIEIADVYEWGSVPGKTVRVKANHSGVIEIGHIVKEDWFNPKIDFDRMGALARNDN